MYLLPKDGAKYQLLQDLPVLVVDNDRDSQDLYTILLQEYGANVTSTGSIKEALKILDWLVPSILVCEIRFLGESVFPLIEKLNKTARFHQTLIPIVATSTSCKQDCSLLSDLGIEAYLLKPIDLETLVLNILDLVMNSRQESFNYASTIERRNHQNWLAV